MRTREYKAALDEIEEGYQNAKDDAFHAEFKSFYESYAENAETIIEEDVQCFLDSFTFPDAAEWCRKEFEDRRDAFEDAKMEEARDKEMGL